MRARCETCDTTRPVEDKDLLDVAVKCPSCGDLLVIEESDDDPAPARQTDTEWEGGLLGDLAELGSDLPDSWRNFSTLSVGSIHQHEA